MWKTPESPRITVADFFEAGRASLQLDWEANAEAAVGREIDEVALNRPGLALAGFLRYFAHLRIQVLGLAEMTYLGSLPPADRIERFRALGRVPGVVMSRGRHARIAQGVVQGVSQQPRAGRSDAVVEQAAQRWRRLPAQRLGQFEVAPGSRIEPEVGRVAFDDQRVNMGQGARLGRLSVAQPRAGRGDGRAQVVGTKAR